MRRSPSASASAVTLACALAACGTAPVSVSSDAGGAEVDLAPAASAPDLAPYLNPLVDARPYMSRVPKDYDAAKAYPLLILLHGYTASGAIQDAYFGLSKIVDARQFLYAYPDGTRDGGGNRFWNATNACCDFGDTGVDDVAYIGAVIDDMSHRYRVDPKRVFLAGHSNGGFMSHRLACDLAPRIAAIMALAGDNWLDTSKCNPSQPVAVLQVHGTADATIKYAGGTNGINGRYPAATESVRSWADKNACAASPDTTLPAIDLDNTLAGSETRITRFATCKPGGAAELWTIEGGSHLPGLSSRWADTIFDWLSAHPKP